MDGACKKAGIGGILVKANLFENGLDLCVPVSRASSEAVDGPF